MDDLRRDATLLGSNAAPQPEQELMLTDAEMDAVTLGRFTEDMGGKLSEARENGRGGWYDPAVCSVEWLWEQMQAHARKANLDMRDIANFAMMVDWRCKNVAGDRERLAAHVAAHAATRARAEAAEAEAAQLRAALAEAEALVQEWRRQADELLSEAHADEQVARYRGGRLDSASQLEQALAKAKAVR